MSEAKPLDRARIEEAFRIMGQYLLSRWPPTRWSLLKLTRSGQTCLQRS
jgi:hypothetical protein